MQNAIVMKSYVLLLLSALCSVPAFAAVEKQPQSKISPNSSAYIIPENRYVTLTFHDIRDDVVDEIDGDPYAIRTRYLARFFDWMKQNQWNPISFQQVIDAQNGKHKLPPNAILLTFDDGAKSSYDKLFPLLKAYQYPALLAVVTSWIADDKQLPYSRNIVPQKVLNDYPYDGLITWDQMREMQQSGLVEFASHSHDLHKGVLANPQGNEQPAAITRLYNAKTKRYETQQEFLQRVKQDLTTASRIFEQQLGVKPRVMVWPYGAITPQVHQVAESVGMPISFALDGLNNQIPHARDSGILERLLIIGNPNPNIIRQNIEQLFVEDQKVSPNRAIKIDLDQIYDANSAVMDQNINRVLEQVKSLKINTVYLKAYSDQNQDGYADMLYFPNRHLPIRADVFNRLAWQLKTRAFVGVYAEMAPLPLTMNNTVADSQQLQTEVYEDLVNNASGIYGLLINDVDGGGSAEINHLDIQRLLTVIGDGINISNHFKSVYEIDIKTWQAQTDPQLGALLAQKLKQYDALVINIPLLNIKQQHQRQQLLKIIQQVNAIAGAKNKVTFNIQAEKTMSPPNQLLAQSQYLLARGMVNLAYTPHFAMLEPQEFDQVFQSISLNSYPYFYQQLTIKQGLKP